MADLQDRQRQEETDHAVARVLAQDESDGAVFPTSLQHAAEITAMADQTAQYVGAA